ncbi:MAG: hypothetical protein WCH11_06305, partial [Bdellovibrio sp.]
MSNADKKDASKTKNKDPKDSKDSKQSKEAKASQDLPVHAFILKSKPQSLKAAESYLVHRGWALKSSDRMKEA